MAMKKTSVDGLPTKEAIKSLQAEIRKLNIKAKLTVDPEELRQIGSRKRIIEKNLATLKECDSTFETADNKNPYDDD